MPTLTEMAQEYRVAAALIARRVFEMRKQADSILPKEKAEFTLRMSCYTAALKEIRATARLMDGYYDCSRLDLGAERRCPEINNRFIPRYYFHGRAD